MFSKAPGVSAGLILQIALRKPHLVPVGIDGEQSSLRAYRREDHIALTELDSSHRTALHVDADVALHGFGASPAVVGREGDVLQRVESSGQNDVEIFAITDVLSRGTGQGDSVRAVACVAETRHIVHIADGEVATNLGSSANPCV